MLVYLFSVSQLILVGLEPPQVSPYDFEANFPALVVLGFNLFHSLRQLSIWNVRNKEWSIEAPSCEPVLLLKFFLFSVSDLHSTFSFG